MTTHIYDCANCQNEYDKSAAHYYQSSKPLFTEFMAASHNVYHQMLHVRLCVSCDGDDKSVGLTSSNTNQGVQSKMRRILSLSCQLLSSSDLSINPGDAYPKVLCVHTWVSQRIYNSAVADDTTEGIQLEQNILDTKIISLSNLAHLSSSLSWVFWVLGQITMFLANKVFPKTLASSSLEIGHWGGVKFCKTSLRVWYLDRAQCSFTQGHKMTLHNEQCGIGSSRTFLVFGWLLCH